MERTSSVETSRIGLEARAGMVFVVTVVLLIGLIAGVYYVQPKAPAYYLDLQLSVTPLVGTGQHVTADIWETNTLAQNNNVTVASHWPNVTLNVDPCIEGWPLGTQLLKGHDTAGNLSEAQQVEYTWSPFCQEGPIVLQYLTFEPHGSVAVLKMGSTTRSIDVNQTYDFYNLSVGQYTVVAADEWGHIILACFSVTG